MMQVEMMRAKIHRIKITQLDLNYVGSITLDEALIEAAGLLVNEKVQVVNINNGARFETYIIKGERNSGIVGLNGPCSRLALPGDLIIVIAYAHMPIDEARNFTPTIVLPNDNNRLTS